MKSAQLTRGVDSWNSGTVNTDTHCILREHREEVDMAGRGLGSGEGVCVGGDCVTESSFFLHLTGVSVLNDHCVADVLPRHSEGTAPTHTQLV